MKDKHQKTLFDKALIILTSLTLGVFSIPLMHRFVSGELWMVRLGYYGLLLDLFVIAPIAMVLVMRHEEKKKI